MAVETARRIDAVQEALLSTQERVADIACKIEQIVIARDTLRQLFAHPGRKTEELGMTYNEIIRSSEGNILDSHIRLLELGLTQEQIDARVDSLLAESREKRFEARRRERRSQWQAQNNPIQTTQSTALVKVSEPFYTK